MRTDIHQHLWTEPLVQALSERRELPFVRRENGLTMLFLAGDRPYAIDLASEAPARRAALVERDGLDRALVCLSSPVGIESLPRAQAQPLLDAYHEGALALGEPFDVWGAIALERPDPTDVDRALARGCVGISLPAGALAGVAQLAHLHPVLTRLARFGAPLLVHPGPAASLGAGASTGAGPLWWPALTHYVAEMQAAWLAFLSVGRAEHPTLKIVFTMLAGLAPLHAERLAARGGPGLTRTGGFEQDPLAFYDVSSYGPVAMAAFTGAIGAPAQLLYGSDRPVVEPTLLEPGDALDWDQLAETAARVLGGRWSQDCAAQPHTAQPSSAIQASPTDAPSLAERPRGSAVGPRR